MRTALLRRSGVARATGVLAASAVVGVGCIASATAAAAEEPTPVTVEKFDAAAFAAQAEALPEGLVEAISRDLGLSASEYLANAATAKSAADAVAALKDSGVEINAAVVDGQKLIIYVAAEADVAAAEAVGATVKIGKPETKDGLEKREVFAAADFKGGYGYATLDDVEAPTSAHRCSAGFNGTDNNGDPLFLTAGHCGADFEPGHPWFHLDVDSPLYDDPNWVSPELLTSPLGENGPMEFGDGQDGGLVNVTVPGWTLLPQVAFWGGGEGDPDDGESVKVYDTTEAIVGQPACKSGATSGWTCGEVLFAEDTLPIEGEDVTAFIFNACMLSGDSGGSILSGNYALGVDSFSTAETTATCDSPNWDPAANYGAGGYSDGDFGGGFAVTSGTTNAEDLFGNHFNLSIHVGKPAVTAPGATSDQTPTFTGTVEAAAGATVTVAIEGGPTVEGTVGANGAWTAAVTETLEPGDYTYTATASHTANGASSETTSAATEGAFEVVEQQVEDLTVSSPTNGQTTSNARPAFTGTGHPGAEVKLAVADDGLGSTTVGDDGTWTLTPHADLPIGKRFDVTVTQTAGDDVQTVTVTDLGISAPDVTITAPADGSTVTGDITFTGTSYAGATIGLLLEQADAAAGDGCSAYKDSSSWCADDVADYDCSDIAAEHKPIDLVDADNDPFRLDGDNDGIGCETEGDDAAADAASITLSLKADGSGAPSTADTAAWLGEYAIDDAGNWTFTPDQALADGKYTITATATLEGGDPKLADSEATASFTVSSESGDNGDESGDAGGTEDGGDLPDTGSSNGWMVYVGIGLLAAGGAAIAVRARRNSNTSTTS